MLRLEAFPSGEAYKVFHQFDHIGNIEKLGAEFVAETVEGKKVGWFKTKELAAKAIHEHWENE
jgi:hypothetical protein